MEMNFKTSFFHRNKKNKKKYLNQGLILIKTRESEKKSILQIDHQREYHVQIKDAVYVNIQIGLASYLKRQRCEIIKKTLNVEQYIRYITDYFFLL